MKRLSLLLILCLGCMETPSAPLPQKLPVGLAASIQEELRDRSNRISQLAVACKTAELDKKQTADEIKASWNESYHSIVGNSVAKLNKLASDGMASAKSPEDRMSVWDALAKGYLP